MKLHFLEAALEDVATLVPRAESDDTLDGFAGKPVSEKRLASRIQPTYSESSVRL